MAVLKRRMRVEYLEYSKTHSKCRISVFNNYECYFRGNVRACVCTVYTERDPLSILNFYEFGEIRFRGLIVVALHLGLHIATSFVIATPCGTS